MLTKISFGICSLINAITFCLHVFVGSKLIIGPVLHNRDLDPAIVGLVHVSWHFGSVSVALLTVLFAAQIWRPNLPLGLVSFVLSAAFAVVGLALAARFHTALWAVPGPYIWPFVTVFAAVGLWGLRDIR